MGKRKKSITQRTRNSPISFPIYLTSGNRENEEIRITTTPHGLKLLRIASWRYFDFGKQFSNAIDEVYSKTLKDTPAKDEQINTLHRMMKLLAALLFYYFSYSDKSDQGAIIKTISIMGELYKDKKDSGTFKIPSRIEDRKRRIRSFKNGYLYDGRDVLREMLNLKDGWLVDQLLFEYEAHVEKMKTTKHKNKILIFVYNLLSATLLYFYPDMEKSEFDHPEYLDKRFVDIGIALKKGMLAPLSNRISA